MNYLLKSRFDRKTRLSKVLLPAAVITALGFLFFTFAQPAFVTLASPLWKAESIVATKFEGLQVFFRTKRSLLDENARLKLALENLELARQAAPVIPERTIPNGMYVAVLAGPPHSLYDTLIVDAGDSEVSEGRVVVLEQGVMLGQVVEVYPTSSLIKLFSSPGERTNAVLERGNIPVIAEGRGAGNFHVALPRDLVVEVGDRILTTDTSARLLAVVGGVSLSPTDSFKSVLAYSPANIFNLWTLVILP
jgi:cell shape-determining protein MreC